MKKEFNFAEAFGNLDEDLVASAAGEWKQGISTEAKYELENYFSYISKKYGL